MSFRALVRSMRLRTLPLSLAGVLCGGIYGYAQGGGSLWTLGWLLLTTVGLQVLSNLSNEMGDHLSGVDGAERQGPAYGMAADGLTEREMWRAINWTVVACAVCGLLMLLSSYGGRIFDWQFLLLLLLGAAAIWAATHYTLGRRPYGYRGWGDVFVFLFFGLVAVLGSGFVMGHAVYSSLLLPAVGIGLLSVAVLNVNNIRDMDSDAGKRTTVPIRMGVRRAKVYQTLLVAMGWLCLAASFDGSRRGAWLMLLTLPIFVWHVVGVWRRSGRSLDPMLPLLVLGTFLLSALYTWGMNYGL